MTTEIESIVRARVSALQNGYLHDRSAAVAALACLRRGAGKPTGSVLEIVEHTHHEAFVRGWEDDTPSHAENAAHAALTLYAVHQQSQRRGMHATGRRFGSAVRKLAPELRADGPVARRFAAVGTADSFTELSHHLRGLVQLMRANQVAVDYGRLARDLWLWQLPGRADSVRLRWGRDFHFPQKDTAPEQGAGQGADQDADEQKDTEQ